MNKLAQKHLARCVLVQAIAYVEHGLSVLPLRLDGSKAPACRSWKNRERELPDWKSLEQDFAVPAGIGVVCGVVSGGLEVLDFDAGDLFLPWRDMVSGIVGKLPVVKTPKGFHVYYRCDVISGNLKIAYLNGRQEAAIETRAEGGYVVAPGSPPTTHRSGKFYEQFSGPTLPRPLLDAASPGIGIPVISEQERLALWTAARSFEQTKQTTRETQCVVKQIANQLNARPRLPKDTNNPADHYDVAGPTWHEILGPHGWTSKDGRYWVRPGKDFGQSAEILIASDGCEIIKVYSSNAGPLAPVAESNAKWGKFRAYAALNHGNDRGSAIRALERQGWGRRAAS